MTTPDSKDLVQMSNGKYARVIGQVGHWWLVRSLDGEVVLASKVDPRVSEAGPGIEDLDLETDNNEFHRFLEKQPTSKT